METAKKPKKRRHSLEHRNDKWGLLLLTPWLIGVILFFIRPLIQMVLFSFNDITLELGSIEQVWTGITNYKYVLTSHATYYQELLTTIATVVPDTIIIVLFALFASVLLNGKFKGRAVFRVIFFLSIIMATDLISVELSTTVNMDASSSDGEVSNLMFLAQFIAQNTSFPPDILSGILGVVANVFDTVKMSGVQTLIFLGGLQTITPSHYEVAKIEGATAYETFFKVTVPMLSPMILTCTVYTIASGFMNTNVVSLINTTSFNQAQYGYGSAMSVIYLVCVLAIIGLASFLIGKKVYYSD